MPMNIFAFNNFSPSSPCNNKTEKLSDDKNGKFETFLNNSQNIFDDFIDIL